MQRDIIVGWIVLFTPPGLVLGALVSFCLVPIYLRLTKKRDLSRKIGLSTKAGIMVAVAAVFVAVMCGTSIFSIERTKNDYWRGRCDWTSWRVPLGMPYELVMTGTMESASIRKWGDPSPLLNDIIRCEKLGSYVVGETGISRSKNDKTVLGWFLFDCTTGSRERFSSYDAFQKACVTAGISPPATFQSVRDLWYTYWRVLEKSDPNPKQGA